MQEEKKYYKIIKFSIGWVGICGTQKGISRLQLPEKNKKDTKEKLLNGLTSLTEIKEGPAWMANLEKKLNDLFSSKNVSMGNIPIDINVSKFQERVYLELRKVSFGSTVTYKDLAVRIKSPKSSRAIGMVMGKNPIPLVIPCHRVISSSKKSIGGFSAYDGINLKRKLLFFEFKKEVSS